MAIDPLIIKLISVGFGAMLVLAALHKFTSISGFRVILIEYQILPDKLVPLTSYLIPSFELVLGAAWILSIYFNGLTAFGTAILLFVYAVAMGINIKRGRVHFDCGCSFGGSAKAGPILSIGHIVRNIILIAGALITLLPVTERAIGLSDFLVLLATILTIAFLLGSINQLLANRAAISVWRKAND
ncbi:MAG: hypothetical protein KTR35_11190 [Gammaproteobacteria bacterium]|nr:hypothetical protein [Gammaproteobacteria bacterium]